MTLNLLLRSFGRVLWFAVAGAICMALVGAVAGSISGGLMIFIPNDFGYQGTNRLWKDVGTGAAFGAIYAVFTGLCSGAIAFGSAGTMACFSNLPKKVFRASWRLAWRATLIGTFIGGVLGAINALLFGRFFGGRNDLFGGYLFGGYMIGVISGFIVGTFYGALAGAEREVARQKAEAKTVLPVVGSAVS